MQRNSIFRPIILASSLITIASLGALTAGLYYSQVAPIAPKAIAEAIEDSRSDIDNRLDSKLDAAVAMAAVMAGYAEVIQGLNSADRDLVVKRFSSLKGEFAAISQYKNIGAHVISADKTSFVKSWNADSFGEKVTHPLIDKILDKKQVTGSLGVGDRGVALTGFAPVIQNKNVIGIVTAVQGVAAITKDLKKINKDWVLLIDDAYLQDRYKGVPASVKENKSIDARYRIAHNDWFDANAVSFVTQHRNANLHGDVSEAKIISDKILVDLPVKDELGNVIGRNIIIEDATPVLNAISSATSFVWMIIGSIALLILIISAVLLLLVKRNMVSPLSTIVSAIQETITSGRFNQRIAIKKMDELGVLTDAFNRLLTSLETSISEANHVVGALAQGDFSKRMNKDYVGDLNLLKEGINTSLNSVSETMHELGVVMNAMQAGNFAQKITVNERVMGDFRNMINAVVSTSIALDSMIADINATMSYVAQGNFNGHRVTSNAQGDLLILKNAINTTLDSLQAVVSDIETVLSAQAIGQLSGRVNTQCNGQLAQLKGSINQTSDKLNNVVQEVNASAHSVSLIAEQVFQGAQDLSMRVQQQASALEETAATMEEMNAAVQNTTGNAQQAAALADNVREKAAAGESVMRKSIAAMSAIRESSAKINDIVSLIDSIAFQTNLLALNAAVEAARAGEHGRGFAVVASEVRALAQKSADAAKEIRDLIANNVQHIESGTRLADESGTMLVDITSSIAQVSGAINQIANATAEQATGISQAHLAISEIDRVTQENAALSEETNAAADNMKDQASQLMNTMSFFEQHQVSGQTLRRLK